MPLFRLPPTVLPIRRSLRTGVQGPALFLALMLSLPQALSAQEVGAQEVGERAPGDAARVAEVTAEPRQFDRPERFEANPAGAGTVQGVGFSQLLGTLGPEARLQATLGEALFDKLWVPAPSSTRASDGLGPLFNARACANCHPGDARGRPPEAHDRPGALTGMVMKLSGGPGPVPQALAHLPGFVAPLPDPELGRQMQDRATPGLAPEGRLEITWHSHDVAINGAVVSLRRPVASAPGGLATGTAVSLRVAPQMIGLGLLQAIPEAEIIARADPGDADGDGISGRVQWALSPTTGRVMPGRFGHKADAARLRDMAAAAAFLDMGLSSPAFPDPAGDCTPRQTACRTAPHGEDAGLRDGHEISGAALDMLAAYAAALSVPARRDVGDAAVLRGKRAFHAAGCAACHVPKHVTARDPGDPARSFQLIWPYTDLLLHDMGPGLADDLALGMASGSEWRTAPLWGIGLTAGNSGHPATYLHDGRARTLTEAILWHGGEAAAARDRVAAMAPETRADLIRFLESL